MKYLAFSLMAAFLLIALTPKTLEAPFIHGYVYDASDSTGIESARVEGKCQEEIGHFITFTDSAGYYAVNDTILPSGWWTVTASHRQYYSEKKEVRLPSIEYVNFYLQPRE